MNARAPAIAASALSAAGLGIAGYLTAVKVAGGLPVCGPLRGCETVASSPYSEVAGIPVALLGGAMSALLLGLHAGWWRSGSRPLLVAAYGLGLFATLFVAWLTWLELFVIHAVCVWCAAYAVTVVAAWGIDGAALLAKRGPAD